MHSHWLSPLPTRPKLGEHLYGCNCCLVQVRVHPLFDPYLAHFPLLVYRKAN